MKTCVFFYKPLMLMTVKKLSQSRIKANMRILQSCLQAFWHFYTLTVCFTLHKQTLTI